MFRTAVIVLLSLLSLALGVAVFTSYRSQRQMADQMSALAEQLKALADDKSWLRFPPRGPNPSRWKSPAKCSLARPIAQRPTPKSKSVTSAMAKPCRRVSTGDDGRFNSGPLAAGDYSLLSPVAGPANSSAQMRVQTAPIYLYPTAPTAEVQIDASYHAGQIQVELSARFPASRSKTNMPSNHVSISRSSRQSLRPASGQPHDRCRNAGRSILMET